MNLRSKTRLFWGRFWIFSFGLLAGQMLFAADPDPGLGAEGGLSACCLGSGFNQAGPSAPAEVVVFGDFNGDKYEDAAFGMPSFEVNGLTRAGAVRVIYGSAAGLDESTAQLWHKGLLPGAIAKAEAHFGASLAVGDFNGDQIDDLAVASPYESLTSAFNVGFANILFGQQGAGLTANGMWTLHGDSQYDHFGFALAAGDFNGDNYSDLAVGAPGVDLVNGEGKVLPGAGSITVYDGASGFLPMATLIAGLGDGAIGDGHGTTLAVGDFDCNGYDDLAAGQPYGGYEDEYQPGNLYVRYGSPEGFESTFYYDQRALGGAKDAGDRFGESLAAGDFNGDGCDDLAVGSPGEDIRVEVDRKENAWPWPDTVIEHHAPDAGVVNVIFGSAAGLDSENTQIWHQYDGRNRAEMPEQAEDNDRFGKTLAAGDFDGDGFADLAIGVPNEEVTGIIRAGLVHVLKGDSDKGLEVWPNERVWVHLQLGDPIRQNDSFGAALGAGDVNFDGLADLAISVPVRSETAGSVVHTLRGTPHPHGPGWKQWQSWYEATGALE